MVDYSDAELGAIEQVFPHCKVFLCDFHREQAWERWVKVTSYHMFRSGIMYRTAENFRGLAKNTIFAEKTFTDCLLLQRQRMLRPQISQRKLSRIVTKPWNSLKFSPSKVFRYTVSRLSNVIQWFASVPTDCATWNNDMMLSSIFIVPCYNTYSK